MHHSSVDLEQDLTRLQPGEVRAVPRDALADHDLGATLRKYQAGWPVHLHPTRARAIRMCWDGGLLQIGRRRSWGLRTAALTRGGLASEGVGVLVVRDDAPHGRTAHWTVGLCLAPLQQTGLAKVMGTSTA